MFPSHETASRDSGRGHTVPTAELGTGPMGSEPRAPIGTTPIGAPQPALPLLSGSILETLSMRAVGQTASWPYIDKCNDNGQDSSVGRMPVVMNGQCKMLGMPGRSALSPQTIRLLCNRFRDYCDRHYDTSQQRGGWQLACAKEAGISPSAVSLLYNGKIQGRGISIATLVQLRDLLGLTLDELLELPPIRAGRRAS